MRRAAALLLASLALGQEADEPAESRLDEGNRKAAAQVRRTFAREGKLLSGQLRGLRKEDLIVVGGLFDFVQEVLTAHRVEHTVITPAELEHHPLPAPERKLFLLNCHLVDRDFAASAPARPRATDGEAQATLERVLREAELTGDTSPGKALLFDNHPYNVAAQKVNDHFTLASPMVIIAEGKKPEAIKDAKTLNQIDLFQRHMEQGEGATSSITAKFLIRSSRSIERKPAQRSPHLSLSRRIS